MSVKIVYFVHDLTDPAVHRRVRMFAFGGAAVTPIGFRRGPRPVDAIEGVEAVDLGPTVDGRLTRRAVSVAGAYAKLDRLAEHLHEASAIVARNLETLFLAVQARRRYSPSAPLVYECLDIHRMLLSNGLRGGLLRSLESRLWRDVDLLLTSSPAFVRNYFTPRRFSSPIRLVENKIVHIDSDSRQAVRARPAGPPWRIGWFGMIRCRRSLDILRALTRAANGAVEVIIRGRPSMAIFPDFHAAIANEPFIHFGGAYRNSDDLPAIFGEVHLNWAIDYYEKGQNSAWLLPNRIYEGSAYGAVPIALSEVETGRWLAQRGVGIVLDDPIERRLADFLHRLDRDGYAKLAAKIEALPRADLISDRSDCRNLVEAICGAGTSSRSGARHPAALAQSDARWSENLRQVP
jgi:succinoglycan biosynthesis protein ExoL